MPDTITANIFDGEERYYDCTVAVIDNLPGEDCTLLWWQEGDMPDVRMKNPNICELHKNCMVQVLTNSYTGAVSVGWYKQDQVE